MPEKIYYYLKINPVYSAVYFIDIYSESEFSKTFLTLQGKNEKNVRNTPTETLLKTFNKLINYYLRNIVYRSYFYILFQINLHADSFAKFQLWLIDVLVSLVACETLPEVKGVFQPSKEQSSEAMRQPNVH